MTKPSISTVVQARQQPPLRQDPGEFGDPERRDPDWSAGVAAVTRLQQRCAPTTITVPAGYRDRDGFPLSAWLSSVRTDYRYDLLTVEQTTWLESTGLAWDLAGPSIAGTSRRGSLVRTNDERWSDMFFALTDHVEYRATAHIGSREVGRTGVHVGYWLSTQRQARRTGALHPARESRLDELAIEWSGRHAQFLRRVELLNLFSARDGHTNVPRHLVVDRVPLGAWVAGLRTHPDKITDRQRVVLAHSGLTFG
jgi:hypothetical protein